MKIKISTRDLKIGMYVVELDRPWRDSPFLFQGFEIRSDDELRALQQHCQEVYVLQESVAAASGPGASAWRDWGRAASPAAKHVAAMAF